MTTLPNAMRTPNGQRAYWILAIGLIGWITCFLGTRAYLITHGSHVLPWDSAWYSQIAVDGYRFDGDLMHQQPVAFLPLFPLAIRLGLIFGFSVPVTILIVCLVSAVAGLLLLHSALSSRLDVIRSAFACVLLLGSPFSIYFLNGYSESLYLLFFGAFWWALLRRRNYVIAAACAGLAGAVRPFGLLLAALWVFALLMEVRRGNIAIRKALGCMIVLGPLTISGMLAVSIFYYLKFGDLFLYRNAMLAWSRDLVDGLASNPLDQIWQNICALFQTGFGSSLMFPPAIARLLLWSFVLTLPFAVRNQPAEMTFYGVALLLFCITTSATGLDLGRHLATNFALSLAILTLVWPEAATKAAGGMPKKWQVAFLSSLFVLGLLTQVWFSSRYFRGQWVS